MDVKKANVLLIKENARQARALSQLIKDATNSDFSLETTEQLAKGLARLEEGGIDLVLLDISSGKKLGLEALKKIKEQAAATPVVVIGGDDQATVAEATRSGAYKVISKADAEVDGRMLIQAMHHAIELAQTENALREVSNELALANRRLADIAHVDDLTQLLNRLGIEQVLEEECRRAQRGGWFFSAVLVDCDDFDRINQSLGHRVGDVVLKEVVGRLKSTLRPTDHIARTGGNEFLLLLPETRLAEGMLVAEKIRLAVAESPLRLTNQTIRVTASLGVMALPYEYSSMEEILPLVRLAVRESKALGKNRVSSGEKHKPGTNKEALEELTKTLREGNCFRAVSMPIFDLKDETLSAYEMLSRGPEGPFEMPDDLFRVSVEYDLLTLVDLRCLKTCLQAINSPKFDKNVRYHVNLFPSTIIDTPIEKLLKLFPKNFKPGSFCIEISEQQFIGDPAYLRDHVMDFKKHGILVAIDDVGFGRSSLESLIILEPDIVKIDRKYVSGIAVEPAKARLLKRLVKVVTALGAELIAEGIEHVEEVKILLDLGVRYGQGWYWGQPS